MRRSWPLERVLFAHAGSLTLLSVLFAPLVSPWLLVLGAVVAVDQLLYVTTGTCPASLVPEGAAGIERGCLR